MMDGLTIISAMALLVALFASILGLILLAIWLIWFVFTDR